MMNRIEKLIEELCPEGVEWKELGEVCEFQRGRTITRINTVPGDVPVIAGGQEPAYYHNEFNREGETIAISGSGAYAGFVSYWTIPVFLSDSFSVNPELEILRTKYVFYFLKSVQDKIYNTKSGVGVPHVYGRNIAKFQIPVPPLPIQAEIVKILDKFSQLEAELEAELEARKTQYEFYRNQLLTPIEKDGKWWLNGVEVEWKTLGEVGEFIRGTGLQKNDFVESGVGCIHYGQIYTYYGNSTTNTISFVSEELSKKLRKAKKNDLIIATVSENIEDVCKAVVWLGDEDICISGDSFAFRHKENPKYIGYLFQTDSFLQFKTKYAQGAKVTRLRSGSLPKYSFPLPPLSEQERIVSILDKFDALVNDITVGLPAEIEARRMQYEYYRNKLLMFE